MYPSVSWPLSSWIRYMRLRRASITSPSISTFASFSPMTAFRSGWPWPLSRPRREHSSLGDDGDVRRLGALGAFALLVLDLCAFGQGLEPVAGDVAVMAQEILPSVLGLDEAVARAVVEPLNGSACHRKTPPLHVHERVRKALRREPDSLSFWAHGSTGS